VAGNVVIKVPRSAQARVRAAWPSSRANWRDSAGSSTMPIEAPNSASGSSRKRSAWNNQVCEPACSIDASALANTRLSCATEAPATVGSMVLETARTRGSQAPHAGRTRTPRRTTPAHNHATCSRPPATTPQASAVIGTARCDASAKAPAIMHRFNKAGARAQRV